MMMTMKPAISDSNRPLKLIFHVTCCKTYSRTSRSAEKKSKNEDPEGGRIAKKEALFFYEVSCE